MKIKELIKELKELRLKADPLTYDSETEAISNWKSHKDGQLIVVGNALWQMDRAFGGIRVIDDSLDQIAKYQLKVIEIENALYGYFIRNTHLKGVTGFWGSYTDSPNQNTISKKFNNWLDDQINNI